MLDLHTFLLYILAKNSFEMENILVTLYIKDVYIYNKML